MRVDRRTMLKGSVLVAAIPLIGAVTPTASRLIIFDSRVAESASFAAGIAGHRLDLAWEHQTQWRALRADVPDLSAVEGLTGWSDWIAVRGVLEARGFRLGREERIAAPLSGKANLFRWSMKGR